METYLLMALCALAFVGTIFIFRVLISDPEHAMLFGAAAGLLVALAAGGVYFNHLASCRMCI